MDIGQKFVLLEFYQIRGYQLRYRVQSGLLPCAKRFGTVCKAVWYRARI